MTVRIIHALADIADHYDAVLCDVWGVIHNGRAAYQAGCNALAAFRELGKPVVLISNAPRPSTVIPEATRVQPQRGGVTRVAIRDPEPLARMISGSRIARLASNCCAVGLA